MVTRRIFVDTEWTAVPWSPAAHLLWIGLCDEAGRNWCALCSDASIASDSDQYVSDLMQLITNDVSRLPKQELSASVLQFCADVTEFWAWIPTLESFAAWSKLGESASSAYQRCKDIDLQMLRSLVVPWPPTWPTELRDLNLAAQSAGAVLPPRSPNHLHPRVHAEWNRQLFSRIQRLRANGDA